MVSILGNVKYSDGTISVLKYLSLLSSNPVGQIKGSLRIYSLLDLHIHASKSGLWKSTIHVYLDLHVYSFFPKFHHTRLFQTTRLFGTGE